MPPTEPEREKYKRFITQFNVLDQENIAQYKYLKLLQSVVDKATYEIKIELDDVLLQEGDDFIKPILGNTASHLRHFYDAVDDLLFDMSPSVTPNYEFASSEEMLKLHRINDAREKGTLDTIPKAILRDYELVLVPLTTQVNLKLRDLRGVHIGKLVKIVAIVTRVSEVKPKMTWATYTCDKCRSDLYDEIISAEYTPASLCMSPTISAQNTKNELCKGQLILQTRGSKFERFQEIKVQETSNQVPAGATPRIMTIHARNSSTRKCLPGSLVSVTGIYFPKLETGFRAIKAGLVSSTYIDSISIDIIHKTGNSPQYISSNNGGIMNNEQLPASPMSKLCMSPCQLKKNYENAMQSRFKTLSSTPNALEILAMGMAPEIYGHLSVKKALLLLLVGGVSKKMPDGLSIRGDINICLMGDPGVAKSQLLKYTCSLAERGIYTTGKGSSGVGLTASVARDPITNEFVLEGGALVLADKGICAIDEFDKMDENDRVAIYEAMEQQTISIAKAGITTTLNARTSVLAAANPTYGRYNESKTLEQNINLPAALLSRFDLMFLLLDRPNLDLDTKLAHHVTHVHQHNKAPDMTPINRPNEDDVDVNNSYNNNSYEIDNLLSSSTDSNIRNINNHTGDTVNFGVDVHFLRQYILKAKEYKPVLTTSVREHIINTYVSLRKRGAHGAETKCTPRALLGIIRLACAHAKIRFSNTVDEADVQVAVMLLSHSKISLDAERELQKSKKSNFIDHIHELIMDHLRLSKDKSLGLERAKRIAQSNGFSPHQFAITIDKYTDLNVWHIDQNQEFITLTS